MRRVLIYETKSGTMRYFIFLSRRKLKIERETKKYVRASEEEISIKRRKCERRREYATKGLIKREDRREETLIEQDEGRASHGQDGERRQKERIDDRRTKIEDRERERRMPESGASAMPRGASAWLNFLLNYYFNRKDERRWWGGLAGI